MRRGAVVLCMGPHHSVRAMPPQWCAVWPDLRACIDGSSSFELVTIFTGGPPCHIAVEWAHQRL